MKNDSFVEYSLLFGARFKCGLIIYWFFDHWVELCEKLLRAIFMVFGSFFCFFLLLLVDLAIFEIFVL